ncbi:unnamed protein product [Caenorhabditis sp. 36 PRJEB53466]|nr:unnamed protein product [Caenorhabditis sp. 36 PRJEB53466]
MHVFQMLAFATPSTSSDFLPIFAHFDVKPSVYTHLNDKTFVSSHSFAPEATSPSSSSDDSGFFDDSEHTEMSCIAQEIGSQLAAMCDDFDSQLLSFRSRRPPPEAFSIVSSTFSPSESVSIAFPSPPIPVLSPLQTYCDLPFVP